MRARNLKPGFFKNEHLSECGPWARLLFAGLWLLADREGRLEDRPRRIKGELFAFDSVEVEPLLAELAAHGFIERYVSDGRAVIQVLAFCRHQNPHHREPGSDLPPPPSPGRMGGCKAPKPRASPPCHDTEAQGEAEALGAGSDMASAESPVPAQGEAEALDPKHDMAGGSSRAESGNMNPEHGIRKHESGKTSALLPPPLGARSQAGPVPPPDPPDPPRPTATALGHVGMALKRAGIDPLRLNLSDARVARLVEAGVTPDEWEVAAREAVARGITSPVAWICATIAGRRDQAAGMSLVRPLDEPAEPEWRRQQRERHEAFLGPAAARRRPPTETIDVEVANAAPRIVG